MDSVGRGVGRFYGNAKGDHVLLRVGAALGSLRFEQNDLGELIPVQDRTGIYWTGPQCTGQAIIRFSGDVPGVPTIAGSKGEDGRFIAYLPTTQTVQQTIVLSRGVFGAFCNSLLPTSIYGVPAEAASLDSYFVAPFRME